MKSEKFVLGLFLIFSVFLLSSVIVSAQENETTTCTLKETDCPIICADCQVGYDGGGCFGGVNPITCICMKPKPCTIINLVKEQVKCVFDGSTQMQKCYTAEQNSRAYCSGTETCIADISGYKGEKITWKSTCGGYAYTVIDGENKYAKFDCSNLGVCQPSKCDDGTITECKIDNGQCICSTCPQIIIKPVCGNGICESGEGEICKTISVMCEVGKECNAPPSECFVVCPADCKQTEGIYADLNEKFKLQVYQPVKIRENENDIIKITFKDLIAYKCAEKEVSSEASETIKSKIAIATGKVIAPTETTETSTTEILKCIDAGLIAFLDVDTIVNSQLGKHFVLNLGVGEKKQIEDFTVSFLGYDYASRTGTFLVSRETFSCPENCKCDENGKIIECAEKCEKRKTLCSDGVCRDKCSIISEDCKYGCSYDGKCFPMGVRSSGMYCGADLNMNSQLNADSTCDNNFECSSNVCVSGTCVSEGFLQKVMNWFKTLFG